MVALLRNATPVPISKTVDICAVDNVDKDNFAVAKGLVAQFALRSTTAVTF